jgi:ABC-type Fe3+/spermidine/putrescine transport system ATPase subunit
VTHDQSEALMLSHRVCLLLDGRLRQVGRPHQLFHRPADPEVARFFGGANFFEGQISGGRFVSPYGVSDAGTGQEIVQVTATIRPEDIHIAHNGNGQGHSTPICGRVKKTNFEGIATRIWVTCDHDQQEFVVLTPDISYSKGDSVHLELPADKVRLFLPTTQSGDKPAT